MEIDNQRVLHVGNQPGITCQVGDAARLVMGKATTADDAALAQGTPECSSRKPWPEESTGGRDDTGVWLDKSPMMQLVLVGYYS